MSTSTAVPSSSPPAPAPPPPAKSTGLGSVDEIPGLIGVSANGTDVYFSTYDTLLTEDQNGDFLKLL